MSQRYRFYNAAAFLLFVLIACPVFQSAGFAQSSDTDRINRIRKQIGPEAGEGRSDELDPLRDGISAAVKALTLRLDALEKDNADVKARVKALEQRGAAPAAGDSSAIEPEGMGELDIAQDGQPTPAPQPRLSHKDKKNLLVNECAGGCTLNKIADIEYVTTLAKPGSVITIAPGVYRLRKAIKLNGQGAAQGTARRTLRAERLGEVLIESDAIIAIRVQRPDWVLENIDLRGVCEKHSKCEHALHLEGDVSRLILRNNRMRDFNSAIKAGGDKDKKFAVDVLIEGNHIFNSTIRDTGYPVTQVDVNGGSRWKVIDNFIADSGKAKGNNISYAGFLKSNSRDGVFARNLVICEWRHKGGTRVGLSFGGGGTKRAEDVCEGGECAYYHTNGVMMNNIVMNCPDVGIFLNKSKATKIYNNTLINTAGIDGIESSTDAVIENNIIFGKINARRGSSFIETNNVLDSMLGDTVSFTNPDEGDLSLKSGRDLLMKGELPPEVTTDFCGNPRIPGSARIGAIAYGSGDCNVAARISHALQGLEK